MPHDNLKIRDELNTSGTTPGDGQSADINPDFIGRTVLDNLNNSSTTPGDGSSAFLNPDFNPSELNVTESVPTISFPLLPAFLTGNAWNMVAYLGTETISTNDPEKIAEYFLSHVGITTKLNGSYFNKAIEVFNVVKNNEGQFFWPEFNFSGMNVEPGEGYQLRIRDEFTDFNINETVSPFAEGVITADNFADYINDINNVEFELKNAFSMIGYNRYTNVPVREALYKAFFPNGTSGHLLNENGLPYSSTHPFDINGRTELTNTVSHTPNYQFSVNGTTGSNQGLLYGISAHPTDTSSGDNDMFRISYSNKANPFTNVQGTGQDHNGATFNFVAINSSLVGVHDDIDFASAGLNNSSRSILNRYYFAVGSTNSETVQNLADKINSTLPDDVKAETYISTLILSTVKKKKRILNFVTSSIGGYLQNGVVASEDNIDLKINFIDLGGNNLNFSDTIRIVRDGQNYDFKFVNVSDSDSAEEADDYEDPPHKNVIRTTDSDSAGSSQNQRQRKGDKLFNKLNEESIVENTGLRLFREPKRNSDGSIQTDSNDNIIYNLEEYFALAEGPGSISGGSSFNGIKLQFKRYNASSFSTRGTLSGGINRGFTRLFQTVGSTNPISINSDGYSNELIDMRLGDFMQLIKNNEGQFYWSVFHFEGLGDLIGGQGYQIRSQDPFGTQPADENFKAGDARNEILFGEKFKFASDGEVDVRPLIDGGPH